MSSSAWNKDVWSEITITSESAALCFLGEDHGKSDCICPRIASTMNASGHVVVDQWLIL
jgi:hypothetical protein